MQEVLVIDWIELLCVQRGDDLFYLWLRGGMGHRRDVANLFGFSTGVIFSSGQSPSLPSTRPETSSTAVERPTMALLTPL